jgi:hypothetical protein
VRFAVVALMLSLGGCEIASADVANQCGVERAELDAGFEAVNDLPVGQSRKVGRCTLKRVAGSERVIVLITKDSGIFTSGRN